MVPSPRTHTGGLMVFTGKDCAIERCCRPFCQPLNRPRTQRTLTCTRRIRTVHHQTIIPAGIRSFKKFITIKLVWHTAKATGIVKVANLFCKLFCKKGKKNVWCEEESGTNGTRTGMCVCMTILFDSKKKLCRFLI